MIVGLMLLLKASSQAKAECNEEVVHSVLFSRQTHNKHTQSRNGIFSLVKAGTREVFGVHILLLQVALHVEEGLHLCL